MCRKLGRGASRALQVAGLLREYASRKKFFEPNGGLVTFTGLDFLAILAGANEKTIRRAVADLEKIGVVRSQQRLNTSNLMWLTTPPDAETHLAKCDRLIEQRRKARQRRRSQMSKQTGQMGANNEAMNGHKPSSQANTNCPEPVTKCPPNLDSLNPTLKRRDFVSPMEDKKEEGVGEEVREAKEERENPNRSPDSFFSLGSAIPDYPRPDAYSRARKLFGDKIGPIIAKAEQRGMPPDEIHHNIDAVINDGGNVDDLAHLLLHGGEYW
jgi:hypothetical protein